MNVSAGTVARTVCLILALINQILVIFGKGTISFAEDNVYQVVSVIFTIVTAVFAWWKNNSFTKAAIKADEFLKEERVFEKEV